MGQTLEYLLRLQDQFSGPMKNARDEQGRFTAGTKKFGESAGAVNSLSGAFVGLAAKIGAAFTAYKALELGFAGLKSALTVAADAETSAISFKNLLGSASAAKDAIKELYDFAAKTPFEMPEVQASASKLLSAGVAANELKDSLSAIGNVTAAYGARLETIATIYGQVLNKGQLYAEEIQQMGENGVPLLRLLSEALGKTTSEVMQLSSAGKLLPQDMIAAFTKVGGAGGRLANAMGELAVSTNGLLSTLSDNVNALFRALGEPLNDAIKPILTDAISLADQLKPVVAELGTSMGTALTAVRDFVAEAQAGSGMASAMGEALTKAFTEAADMAAVPFRALGEALPAIGKGLMAIFKPAGDWIMAKLDSAALSFSSKILTGIRDALKAMSESSFMASMIPGLGAAADSLNGPAAMAQNDATNANTRAANIADAMPDFAKQAMIGLEEGMGAFRTKWSSEMERLGGAKAKAQNSLPPSVLDKGYNPMFPNGVLPPGAVAGKSSLPPSALDGPGKGAPASFFDELAGKSGQKAAPAGGNAVGLDAAKAGVNAPAAAAKKSVEKAATVVKAPMSAVKPVDAGMMPGGPRATPMERINAAMGQDGGEGGGGRIRGYSQSQGGRRMGMGDGGPLSARRSATPNVPSPGTARRAQERREAAATATKAGGGEHPLMALVKQMQAKLDTLAVAS